MADTGQMLNPGQKAPKAGTYEVVGPRGGSTGRMVKGKRGKPLPPTPAKGQKYLLVEKPAATAKPKTAANKRSKTKK